MNLASGEGLLLVVLCELQQGGLVGNMFSRVILRFTDLFRVFVY